MIRAYLTDSVTWVKSGGMDEWNTPKTPTKVIVEARVKESTRLVRSIAGVEVASSAEILLLEKPGYEDKFNLGDGVERPVIAVQAAKGFTVSHYRVYVG